MMMTIANSSCPKDFLIVKKGKATPVEFLYPQSLCLAPSVTDPSALLHQQWSVVSRSQHLLADISNFETESLLWKSCKCYILTVPFSWESFPACARCWSQQCVWGGESEEASLLTLSRAAMQLKQPELSWNGLRVSLSESQGAWELPTNFSSQRPCGQESCRTDRSNCCNTPLHSHRGPKLWSVSLERHPIAGRTDSNLTQGWSESALMTSMTAIGHA